MDMGRPAISPDNALCDRHPLLSVEYCDQKPANKHHHQQQTHLKLTYSVVHCFLQR